MPESQFRLMRYVTRQRMRGYLGNVIIPASLPLDLEDAIVGFDLNDVPLVVADLDIDVDLWSAPFEWIAKKQDAVQDRFEKRTKHLAALLAAGTLTLLAWHTAMRDEIKRHTVQQAYLGSRGKFTDPRRIDGIIRRETDYLSRFADQIARNELTPAAIESRSAMYGGTARATFFREHEPSYPPGYVFEYVARDDERTCDPCEHASGYYLPGVGPMPGEICLGRARCRCRRIPRYLPDVYEALRHGLHVARGLRAGSGD